ncbi:GerAB/ArcD/ProY family transporter [Paenibacillus sp. FSL W8-1187]|uniref:GerAB/ArcD/ProY family transporter n=1 Tax=Paenibacillus sp. FSL W8-1187 TaxID=2975339 RepID=UPI0030DCB7D9
MNADKLTNTQISILIVNYMLATAILVLPRMLVDKAGTPDVWLSLMLAGVISAAGGWLASRLSLSFPGETIFQYGRKLIGKGLGAAFGTSLVLYFLVICGLEARSLEEITTKYLLEGTPSWAVTLPFLWLGAYLVLGGIQAIVQASDLIFPLTGFILLVVLLLSLRVVEFSHLLPVLGQGLPPVLRSMKTAAFAYSGPELMLLLVAYMKRPRSAGKAYAAAIAICMAFYVVTTVIVIGAFSIDGVTLRTWPTIDLIRSFEIPGLIFERYESLILAIWIMKFFSTFVLALFASSLGISQLFRVPFRTAVFAQLPFIYIVQELPKTIEDVFHVWDYLSMAGAALSVGVPALLLVLQRWKKGAAHGRV